MTEFEIDQDIYEIVERIVHLMPERYASTDEFFFDAIIYETLNWDVEMAMRMAAEGRGGGTPK